MERKNRDKGSSAVEFVLVLPLLILILFAIIEYSLLMYNKAVLTNASREGARGGIIWHDPRVSQATMIDIVNAYCASNLISFASTAPAITVTNEASGGNQCVSTGDYLTVSVSYPYTFLVLPNFLNLVLPSIATTDAITLRGVTVMRCE